MFFKQLFEPDSSTYSYVLACPQTGECAIIDPVLDTAERDLSFLHKHNLKLTYTIDTHIHADHLTGARRLKSHRAVKSRIRQSMNCPVPILACRKARCFVWVTSRFIHYSHPDIPTIIMRI